MLIILFVILTFKWRLIVVFDGMLHEAKLNVFMNRRNDDIRDILKAISFLFFIHFFPFFFHFPPPFFIFSYFILFLLFYALFFSLFSCLFHFILIVWKRIRSKSTERSLPSHANLLCQFLPGYVFTIKTITNNNK